MRDPYDDIGSITVVILMIACVVQVVNIINNIFG